MRPIQVVDDDAVGATGLTNLLTADGWQMLQPIQDPEAIEAAREPVVVCDLHLRGAERSGPTAVRFIADELSLPVVAISGLVSASTTVNAIAAGALGYQPKSVFRPRSWNVMLTRAQVGARSISPHLAAALLEDARARPLNELDELSPEAEHYLHDVLRLINRDDFDDALSEDSIELLGSIWRVSRNRWKVYRIEMSALQRSIAKLKRLGMTSREIADELGHSKRTVDSAVTDYKKKVLQSPHAFMRGDPRNFELLQGNLLVAHYKLLLEEEGKWSMTGLESTDHL